MFPHQADLSEVYRKVATIDMGVGRQNSEENDNVSITLWPQLEMLAQLINQLSNLQIFFVNFSHLYDSFAWSVAHINCFVKVFICKGRQF